MTETKPADAHPRGRLTYFLRVFLPAALLVLLAVTYLKREDEHRAEAQLRSAQELAVRLGVEALTRELEMARADARLMATMERLRASLVDPSASRLSDVGRDFLLLARIRQAYQRVRWIDERGEERINVALAVDGASGVTPLQRRNLRERYYFMAGESLNPGDVYVSPLDRSRDGAGPSAEDTPVLRIVSALFDERGARRGVLVLDYRADLLLGRFADVTRDAPGQTWLLNGNGFALASTAGPGDGGDRMAQRAALGDVDAAAWAQVRATPQGSWRNDSGTWVWHVARPVEDTEAWIVVSFMPRGGAIAQAYPYQRAHVIVGLVVLLFVSGIGWVLASALQKWAQSRAALEALTVTDTLTGLGNRRGFFAKLAECQRLHERHPGLPLGVLMLDLDHFKSVNDRYGHAGGDDVLREFGQRLAGAIRPTDFAARLGGEEFGVILLDSDLNGVAQFAERLRADVAGRPFHAAGESLPITVSLGGAAMQPDDRSPEQALERADRNLYRAKEAGRNRVVASDSVSDSVSD